MTIHNFTEYSKDELINALKAYASNASFITFNQGFSYTFIQENSTTSIQCDVISPSSLVCHTTPSGKQQVIPFEQLSMHDLEHVFHAIEYHEVFQFASNAIPSDFKTLSQYL